jgi:hypothetical protein
MWLALETATVARLRLPATVQRDMAGVLRHVMAHTEVRQLDIARVVAGVSAGAGEPHAAPPA